MRLRVILVTVAALAAPIASPGGDWIHLPSYYTHNPETGERVQQYRPLPQVARTPAPDFQRSGYRQSRSSIIVGGRADHYHVVEEWGRSVRPYGEWQRPYRPYSVPYQQWGPPFGGLGIDPYFDGLGRPRFDYRDRLRGRRFRDPRGFRDRHDRFPRERHDYGYGDIRPPRRLEKYDRNPPKKPDKKAGKSAGKKM